MGRNFNPDSLVFAMYPEGATTPDFMFIEGGYRVDKF
jgi:hypothetical protein